MTTKWISTGEAPAARWQEKSLPQADDREPTLVLDGRTHQTVKGFGGCFNELGWDALCTLSERDRKGVLEALFSAEEGCGFTFCRMPIGASDYARSWYSLSEVEDDWDLEHFSLDRDRTGLIPYIRAAQAIQPKLTLFASPWSPPTWMKTRRTFNNGVLRWEEPVLKTYAFYFRRVVEAYAAEGIPIEQVHVQNEPRSNQKFPSCLWTGERMRDFIRDYLGPCFAQADLDCAIWAGTIEKGIEHGWATVGEENYARWAHTLLSDARARAFIGGVGYQWDGKGAAQRTALAWPEVPIIQTENECGDGQNTWTYAHYVFDLIWHYFQNNTVAYTYWNMVLPAGGESTWGWQQNAMITITDAGEVVTNPEFYVMKHLAAHIRPGAVRLGTRGPWTAFCLAFRNPDDSTVFFLANPLAEAQREVLEVEGARYALDLAPRSFHTLVCRE